MFNRKVRNQIEEVQCYTTFVSILNNVTNLLRIQLTLSPYVKRTSKVQKIKFDLFGLWQKPAKETIFFYGGLNLFKKQNIEQNNSKMVNKVQKIRILSKPQETFLK